MSGRAKQGSKSVKKAPGGGESELPRAAVVSDATRKRAYGEIVGGGVIIVASWIATVLGYASESRATGKFLLLYGPLALGLAAIVVGAIRLTPKTDPSLPPRADVRRWIYGGIGVGLAVFHYFALVHVIPNRLPTAWVHLWSFPLLTITMACATLMKQRWAWWVAVLAASALVVSVVFVIARILASAAFLAGTYGAFGKAASTFSLVAVALIINGVALLPIVQVKWLMSRAGRRAYGV